MLFKDYLNKQPIEELSSWLCDDNDNIIVNTIIRYEDGIEDKMYEIISKIISRKISKKNSKMKKKENIEIIKYTIMMKQKKLLKTYNQKHYKSLDTNFKIINKYSKKHEILI